VLLLVAGALPGCGATRHLVTTGARPTSGSEIPRALLLRARPIGAGPRFHPAPTGGVLGRCVRGLGPRSAVHVEVFAANRVVIVPAGIGVQLPFTLSAGRIVRAHCYGELVTLEPTGVVLVRTGARTALSDLFRAWGQPLSLRLLTSFAAPAGRRVTVFVDGQRWRGAPGSVPLTSHAEIVLEIGPHVPPHTSFTFPPGA
jgi:hypothetical protein